MNTENEKQHTKGSQDRDSLKKPECSDSMDLTGGQETETDLWKDGDILEQVVSRERQQEQGTPRSEDHPRINKDIPKSVGRYPVKELIGKGASGTVYLGTHPGLERDVAIKVMSLNITKARDPLIKRFIQEAKITDRFNHPNIIRVYDAGEDESEGYYIVMEYAERGAVSSILEEKGRLDVDFTVHIVKSVASALSEANKYNVIHRDIKPQNIMLTEGMDVKLADLGLAKYTDVNSSETMTNMCIGTLNFMAPEQIQDAKHVDGRADIYALGASFYTLITGEPPFKGDSHYNVMQKVVLGEFKRPEMINSEIDPRIGDIICKMMARKPQDRYQSANELLDALECYENEKAIKPTVSYNRYLKVAALLGVIMIPIFLVAASTIKDMVTETGYGSPELMSRVSALVTQSRQDTNAFSHIHDIRTYNNEIDQLLSEASIFSSNKNYRGAFENYRKILKSLRKIDGLRAIGQWFVSEQQQMRTLATNAAAMFPTLEHTAEWKQSKLIEDEAVRLLNEGEMNKAIERLKDAIVSYRTILNNSYQQEISTVKSEVASLRQQAIKFNTAEFAPTVWLEAESLASQAKALATTADHVQTIKLWGMALSQYRNANKRARSIHQAENARKKYEKAISTLDQSVLDNHQDSAGMTISDYAHKAQQYVADEQFQLASETWYLATALVSRLPERKAPLANIINRFKEERSDSSLQPTREETAEDGTKKNVDPSFSELLKKAQSVNEYFDILVNELGKRNQKEQSTLSSPLTVGVGEFICKSANHQGFSKLSRLIQNAVELAVDRSSDFQLISRKYYPASSQHKVIYAATEDGLNEGYEFNGFMHGVYTYDSEQIHLDLHLDPRSSDQAKSVIRAAFPIDKFYSGAIDHSLIFPANIVKTSKNEADVTLIGQEIPNRELGVDLWLSGGRRTFAEGEYVNLIVRPEKDCHIAVFCHYVDGSTVLLFPNEHNRDTFVRAERFVNIPGEHGMDDKEGFKLEAGPPFGGDIIQVIACTDKQALRTLLEDKVPLDEVPLLATVDRTKVKDRLRGLTRGIKVVPSGVTLTSVKTADFTEWGEARLAIFTYPN